MDQLFPTYESDIDPSVLVPNEQRPSRDRPWLMVNMVASIDGAIEIGGVSGPIGGSGDAALFRALRAIADVILVGGGTARAENYGPPKLDTPAQVARTARGQAALPALAVISGSLGFDPAGRLFDGGHRPLLFTTNGANPERVEALEAVADIERFDGAVTAEAVVGSLHGRGYRTILLEGGPSLNAQFLDADLIDEVCATVAPKLTASSSRRMIWGDSDTAREMDLQRIYIDDGELYLRYVRSGDRHDGSATAK
jgi:riboflavin biosynthesis pyrimidine reductase